MAQDDRWIEVSQSAFAHEAEGLAVLRDLIPASPPYRAWTNFEFMDNHGQWHEIDALVLGRRRLHLIELKAYTGLLQGTEQSWIVTSLNGKKRTQRSPLLVTRRKAQRLATRIEEEARKIAVENGLNPDTVRRSLPFVQESVFLHGSPFGVDMSDLAKSSLFGPDGLEDKTSLPGISTRILEPPSSRNPYGEDMSVIIALALKQLGVLRRTERDAGSWTISGKPTASGSDWQEWPAIHKSTNEHGRARVVSLRRGTPSQARAASHRRIQREFSLISSLRQESIVAPRDLVQDDDGNTVIVYPDLPDFEPLDLALATHTLTADQQVQLLSDVADALAYAHRNQVANRGLNPSTVLINTEALERGEISIRLADWSWAGRIHGHDTQTPTILGNPVQNTATTDDVYQAPEDRWASDADRLAIDVFSLGALAYFVLSGGQSPARDRAALLDRLRQEQGLDLAASGGRFVDEKLRSLVRTATCPSVSMRVDTDKKTGQPRFGVSQFAAALAEYRHQQLSPASVVDPLNPIPGTVIDDRFEVVKVLGAGSTARGVLVKDRAHDDVRRVLKVGLDDSAAARLHDEAQVLAELGRQVPLIPGVVQLVDGPMDLSGRTALVLTDCGEQTLSDVVRYTPLSETRLSTWGTELLSIVVALDAAGISHRDIKPSNLGLARAEGRAAKTRLALFDFSLSRAHVAEIDAGTPPYRDPFLGTGTRTSFDSAAERYSAAVVLFQMATALTPVYGDGLSDPRALRDDVAVTPEDFTAAGLSRSRAEGLTTFFRTALTRDAKARFDTASAMRDAWAAAFTTKRAAPTPPQPPAPRPTDPRETEPTPPNIARPYESLDVLAAEFAKTAGNKPAVMRRQVVELVLGTHANAPSDPFVTYAHLGAAVGVTPGRIAQIFGEFPTLWAKNERVAASVTELFGRGQALLASQGGASTPEQLASELAGMLTIGATNGAQRVALGVLRLLMSSQPDASGDAAAGDSDRTIQMVRRHGSGTVAMIATQAVSRRLPAELAKAAEKLVADAGLQGTLLVTPGEAEHALRTAASDVLDVAPADVEIPAHVLLRIASIASTGVALSSRDELHAASLSVDGALRVLLRGLASTDRFGRAELESRLSARFPALARALPRRPELDALIEAVAPGMRWDEVTSRYGFTDVQATGSTIPTHTTITSTQQIGRGHGISEVEHLLAASVRERTFRALGVPLGKSDAVAAALKRSYGATHIDVTELILTELRERASAAGLDWSMVLAADAGAAADRDGLTGFVAQVIPSLMAAVDEAHGPVVLTDLSTLAAYGQLVDVVHVWSDIAAPLRHAVWALIPQPRMAGGGGPRIDDTALPLDSPEQFVLLGEPQVRALATTHESAMTTE